MALLQKSTINSQLKITGSNNSSSLIISSSATNNKQQLVFGTISKFSISSLVNSNDLIFKHDTTNILNLDNTGKIKINDTGSLVSNTINTVTEYTGSGFSLHKNDNKWLMCIDQLLVRGSMRIYELLINQIRATNGTLFVSSTGKSVSGSSITINATSSIVFQDSNLIPFTTNDIIRAQRFNYNSGSQSTVYQINLQVLSVSSKTVSAKVLSNTGFTLSDYNGAQFVRIGNTSNTNRQGYIMLSSQDNPYIDIANGVNSVASFGSNNTRKVRLGSLTGVSSSAFGNLNGYGFYTDNGYLQGGINATNGKIAGWNINPLTGISKDLTSITTTTNYWFSRDTYPNPNNSIQILKKSNITGSGTITPGDYITVATLIGDNVLTGITGGTRVAIKGDHIIVGNNSKSQVRLILKQSNNAAHTTFDEIGTHVLPYAPAKNNIITNSFIKNTTGGKLFYQVRIYNIDTSNINANTVSFTHIRLYAETYGNVVSQLSNQGLMIFKDPANYVKFGSTTSGEPVFDIATQELTVKDLNVTGDLYTSGKVYAAANNLTGTSAKRFRVNTDAGSTIQGPVGFQLLPNANTIMKMYADDSSTIKFSHAISSSNVIAPTISSSATITANNINASSVSASGAVYGNNLVYKSRTLRITGSNGITLSTTSAVDLSANRVWTASIASDWTGQNTITTLGTITTGTWNGSTIGTANGGTGQTSYSANQILMGNSSGVLSKFTVKGSANQVLISTASNNLTFSLPQSIATSSNVTFNDISGAAITGTSITGTSITQTSLRQLKTNINKLDKYLEYDKLLKLNPVKYNLKQDLNNLHYGFIAQELEQIYPQITSYNDQGKLLGIKYQRLVTPIISMLQVLDKQNKQLKYRLDRLEQSKISNKIKRLFNRIKKWIIKNKRN